MRSTYPLMHPTHQDEAWDCVLDKATLDALICVDEEEDETVQRMLDEAWRVLKPGGRYVCISNSNCKDLVFPSGSCGVDSLVSHTDDDLTKLRAQRRWKLIAEEKFKLSLKKQSFWMGVFVKIVNPD